MLCKVGDAHRSERESKFARWSGTGAVALSSGEGAANPVKHRLDFRGNRRINSVLYIASVTQQRSQPEAAAYLARKAAEGKTRREARRATNANSPTGSSAECGATKPPDNTPTHSPLDKGASDSPPLVLFAPRDSARTASRRPKDRYVGGVSSRASRPKRFSVEFPDDGAEPYAVLPLGSIWPSHPEAAALAKVIWDSGGRDRDWAMSVPDGIDARSVARRHAQGRDADGGDVGTQVQNGAKRVLSKLGGCLRALEAAGVAGAAEALAADAVQPNSSGDELPIPPSEITQRRVRRRIAVRGWCVRARTERWRLTTCGTAW